MTKEAKSVLCSNCRPLGDYTKINNPAALRSVLLEINRLISKDKIKEHSPERPSSVTEQPQFSTINPEGPYPDIMNYHFRCSVCKTPFELSVETYHGMGGYMRMSTISPET